MSDPGYTIRDRHAVHFITCSVVQWIWKAARESLISLFEQRLQVIEPNAS